ncbi:hypothetical protein [Streptococcus sp. DD12]|uniref:hypothetical protein n=1 Tax=Streptococcus sp. DD12 TaxID=1777880 RepID=UPI00079C3395|nr:hypothetical protein [Streptococcus sp. DD12]KXT76386.1 hypothetical protein STRDD12_00565 [Streptococcus sp. DD12]
MQSLLRKLSSSLEVLGRSAGVLIFGLLFIVTMVLRTTMMTGLSEWAMITREPWYVYLTAFILLALGLYWPRLFKEYSTRQIRRFFTICYLIFGLSLVLLTAYVGRDDAGKVFEAALQFNAGDYHLLEPGGYMFRYPHQLGLVSFERLVLWAIPIPLISVFFALNLAFVLGMNTATYKIAQELFGKARWVRATVIVTYGFLPLLFNIMFAYGLMFGLFFAVWAVYFAIRYLKWEKWSDALWSLLLMTVAYWVRSNNVILIVALLGVFVLHAMKRWRFKPLLLGLAYLVFALASNKATVAYYEQVSHQKISGTPQLAWVAMGIQEDESSNREPGWYTGYVRKVYFREKGDIKKIEANAKHLVLKRVSYFLSHPEDASWFFGIKFLSSWTEGSFQSIWSGPSKAKKQPLWNSYAKSIYHQGSLHLIFITYMQAFLILIYLGGLCYYLFSFKRLGDQAHLTLYALLVMFGAIIFHLGWETKSQYILPYIYFQLPMVAVGLSDGFGLVSYKRRKRRQKRQKGF